MLGSLPLLLTAPEQGKVIFPFQTLTKVAAAPTTKLFQISISTSPVRFSSLERTCERKPHSEIWFKLT